MKKFSRRTFAKLAGGAALASTAELPSLGFNHAAQNRPNTGREFPPGFIWGTATASYQVEAPSRRTVVAHPSGTPSRTRPAK